MGNQTQVTADKLFERASVGVGDADARTIVNTQAAEAIEFWPNVFDVGGGGTLNISIRSSYKEDADVTVDADWHELGTFALSAAGIPAPLVFNRQDDPLGKRTTAVATIGTNAVEFELIQLTKETF